MAAAQSELSMDEILASIRRIIDEEEHPSTNADSTNTVNLRKEPSPPRAKAQASEPAEQLREARVTSVGKPDKAEALKKTPPKTEDRPVATMEPDAVATEKEKVEDETFDAAPARSLARAVSGTRSDDDAKPAAKAEAAPKEQEPKVSAKPTATVKSIETAQKPKAANNGGAHNEGRKAVIKGQTSESSDALIGDAAAAGVSAAFASLQSAMRVSKESSTTIEDMVQEMLRPMLKKWLDENLQDIVERKVEDELRRVSGQ